MSAQGLVFSVGRKCVEQFKTLGTKAALEAYVRDELDEDELIAALLLRCRRDIDATREAMSLLDEYHRRGLVDTIAYLSAKTELNMLLHRSPLSAHTAPAPRPTVNRVGTSALDQFSSGAFE